MNNSDSSASFKIVMEIADLPAAVTSLDANKQDKYIAFGLENGSIYVLNLNTDESA